MRSICDERTLSLNKRLDAFRHLVEGGSKFSELRGCVRDPCPSRKITLSDERRSFAKTGNRARDGARNDESNDSGGTDTALVVLEAYPDGAQFVVLVQVQVVTDGDLEALDTILATFDATG